MSNHTLMLLGNTSGELGMTLLPKFLEANNNIVLVDRKTDPKVSFRSLLKNHEQNRNKNTNQKVLTYKLDLSRTSYLKIFMGQVKESFQTVQTIVFVSDSIPLTRLESFSTHQLQLYYRRNILAFSSVIRSAMNASILNTHTTIIFVTDTQEEGIVSNLCEAGIEALAQTIKIEMPTMRVAHLHFRKADSIVDLVDQIVRQVSE